MLKDKEKSTCRRNSKENKSLILHGDAWHTYSPTIDTRFDTPSNGTNSHPELNRSITPREAARIQSFDDEFVFYGSKFYIRSQIGNAVPPLMAQAIADKIWENYDEQN